MSSLNPRERAGSGIFILLGERAFRQHTANANVLIAEKQVHEDVAFCW